MLQWTELAAFLWLFFIILSIVNFQRLTFCDSLLSRFLNIFQSSISKNFRIRRLQHLRHQLLPCKLLQSWHCNWQLLLHRNNRSILNYDRPIQLHVDIRFLSRSFGWKIFYKKRSKILELMLKSGFSEMWRKLTICCSGKLFAVYIPFEFVEFVLLHLVSQ